MTVLSTPITPTPATVYIVKTGVANLGSVVATMSRIGAEGVITEDPAVVAAATYVIVPGVGAFGQAMERVRHLGLDRAIKERVNANRPTMFICVGQQILGNSSDESEGAVGLQLVNGHVSHLPKHVRVPQQGWNRVLSAPESLYLTSGYAYFSNSYAFLSIDPQQNQPGAAPWIPSVSYHGAQFIASLERGAVLATQFHP
eukprot:TRINITY_DN13533_c0_g1_i1.p1 TRINITY_DN13533_c0_g1~~TRINITY_DN13533_c0_g1_i1.p1  ORF type:complete len:208 (-),score=26.89 TRINITY_DN13533_c0_g1_i1:68-667(-)